MIEVKRLILVYAIIGVIHFAASCNEYWERIRIIGTNSGLSDSVSKSIAIFCFAFCFPIIIWIWLPSNLYDDFLKIYGDMETEKKKLNEMFERKIR